MFSPTFFLLFIIGLYNVNAMHFAHRLRSNGHRQAQCQPFQSTFAPSDISQYTGSSSSQDTPFVVVSPEDSYQASSDGGLQMFLQKPNGKITTKDGVNDRLADGATINSTFTLLYGKVSFTITSPVVPGVVTAAILIADEHDEIDVELLGGDTSHWQSNVFAPNPADSQPLWGVFGQVEEFPSRGNVQETHEYTVDWNAERIVWSVDGSAVRTLSKDDTEINGTLHYPSHPTRLSLGIWDASAPQGTAQWADGPVEWEKAPQEIKAIVSAVTVECPY